MKTLPVVFIIGAAACFGQGWTVLPNTAFSPSGLCQGTQGDCSSVIEAWSGAAFDSLRSRLLVFGSGHGDGNDNSVFAIYPPGTTPVGIACSSVTAPAICRIKNASASLRSTSGPCFPDEPDGVTPNSRHSYDGLVYIANRDTLFVNGGSVTCGSGSHYGDTWTLPLSTLTWATKDPTTNVNGGGGAIFPRDVCSGCVASGQGPWVNAVYDPNTQLVFLETGLQDRLWSYNEAINTYTSVKSGLTFATNATWVVDPKRKRIYTFGYTGIPFAGNASTATGTPVITYIDIAAGGTYNQTNLSVSPSCNGLAGALSPGVDYDPVLDKIVGWPNFGNTVYIFDPVTATCTTQTFSGGPPDSRDASNTIVTTGTFGRFKYIPSLNSYIVINDATTNAYLLKLNYTNSIKLTNNSTTVSNYPVQIGRVFAQSEIPNGQLPQAFVSGSGISTQVDVKSRWSDGSLKHAILSFIVTSIPSSSSVTVAFAAGTTVGNTTLTQTQMLSSTYNFDATIVISKAGVAKTSSARTMLSNSDYTFWTSGPIATTVLLGNHAQSTSCGGNAASTYDVGFDGFCSFRPLYQATFWPNINKVYIRYIGELANSEQFEDVTVDLLTMSAGNIGPVSVYSRSSALTMHAGSRWTKTYWLGGTPPTIDINHNQAYLAYAKATPNYENWRVMLNADIAAEYTSWLASSKDLYNFGKWDHPIGGGGGHSHVGPMPAWNTRWLYYGDYRSQEEAIGQAELLSTLEWHVREGKSGKKLDRAGSISGIGYPISISSRPTLQLYDRTLGNTADRVIAVGSVTNNGWDSGTDFTYWGSVVSHQPVVYTLPYLLTGDYFFLEESMFQASFNAALVGAATSDWRSRGPTGVEGGIIDKSQQRFQSRGQAWSLLNRVETAWILPDSNSFKGYLNQLIDDTLALWEGQRNLTTGTYYNTTMWTYGLHAATVSGGAGTQWDSYSGPYGVLTSPSPLHFWDNGNSAICDSSIQNNVVQDCNSPWMEAYVLIALGRSAELGYNATVLRNWLGENPVGALTDAGFNPYMAAAYRSSIIKASDGLYFTTWAASKTGFINSVQTETDFYPGTIFAGTESLANGNVQPIMAAVSMVPSISNGAAAWSWVSTNIKRHISGADLKWAIVPRPVTTAISANCTISPVGAGPYVDGQVVAQSFVASNCSASSWAATGLSGSGLSIDSGTGLLSGTATTGVYSVTITYDTASNPMTIVVTAAPVTNHLYPLPVPIKQ
jgi:hypothetical protein